MGNTMASPMSLPKTSTSGNMAADLKPTGIASANVKPCCVCKDEKATRDECMLFSKSENPDKDCASTIDKYRSCMAGFGFKMV